MFVGAHLVLINKVDLLPHLDVTLDQIVTNVRAVAPTAGLLPVSATRGEGMTHWYRWLERLASPVIDERHPAG
jgi:hydrogenase nickel incorporation protein HypB